MYITVYTHRVIKMIVGVLTTCHIQYTKVFFYDVRCAVVMHFSAWSAVY